MDDRYAGKPFLRMVECYVLWCIGRLPPEQEQALERMAPRMRETLSLAGTWQEVVAAQANFPPGMDAAIRRVWEKNEERFRANDEALDPEDFARMFVDKNFT